MGDRIADEQQNQYNRVKKISSELWVMVFIHRSTIEQVKDHLLNGAVDDFVNTTISLMICQRASAKQETSA